MRGIIELDRTLIKLECALTGLRSYWIRARTNAYYIFQMLFTWGSIIILKPCSEICESRLCYAQSVLEVRSKCWRITMRGTKIRTLSCPISNLITIIEFVTDYLLFTFSAKIISFKEAHFDIELSKKEEHIILHMSVGNSVFSILYNE